MYIGQRNKIKDPEINQYICGQSFPSSVLRPFNGKEQSFQIALSRQQDIHMQNTEVGSLPHTVQKLNKN